MEVRGSGLACLRVLCLFTACLGAVGTVVSQAAPAASGQAAGGAARQSGTVKEVHAHDFVLTTAGGDITVSLPETSRVMIVPPGSKSLSDAKPGAVADLQPGDRALVTGTPGDTGTALSASRVILMKSGAIAAVRAAESSAWAQGSGGIVKAVSGDAITLSSGMKTLTVQTTPSTIVRRYAPGSVNFADATSSAVTAIQPGDQMRVRGAKSGDGSTITADEIVSGNFKNYSGTIASIEPSAATITLKDLTTKRTVTVAVTANSDVRRLPPQMAAMVAGRLRGGQAGAAGGSSEGSPESARPRPAGDSAGRPGATGGSRGAGGSYGAEGVGGGRAAGADLSRMLSRLPTETLAGLKQGDAVMIVATAASPEATDKSTAITLLAGVEAILAAPAGQSTTLSPWNVGGEGEMAGSMGGGPQ